MAAQLNLLDKILDFLQSNITPECAVRDLCNYRRKASIRVKSYNKLLNITLKKQVSMSGNNDYPLRKKVLIGNMKTHLLKHLRDEKIQFLHMFRKYSALKNSAHGECANGNSAEATSSADEEVSVAKIEIEGLGEKNQVATLEDEKI